MPVSLRVGLDSVKRHRPTSALDLVNLDLYVAGTERPDLAKLSFPPIVF